MNMTYSAPIMIGTSTSSTSILTKTSSSSLKSSYSSNSSSSYYSSTLMSCEFLSSLSKDLSLLLEDDTFDLTQWTYKEWELLSEKLENFIPLIRFLHISSGDFYKKVKPFARILPIELYEDLLQYYLVPNHQPSLELMQPKRSNFNSVIIERKQVAMIASWIDKKDLVNKYNNKKRVNINNNPNYQSSFYEPWENPYEFKLLLRGSRDGFTGLDFHSKCDSKGATITIMKVNGSSELYGGYTPIDWLSQNTWGYCKESFIFCLDDKDLDKSIISRVKDPSRAINYYNNYGPSFGTGDLKMTGNFKNESRCCCQHGDYELPIRANSDDIHFSVDEYEVFQIIPRRRRKRNMD
ncbi:5825_t:CDS:2 [Entrophospora sp. SA101]|nr:5825_t:CDS:2 [Entrophospora sp. SA101]